MNDQARNVAFLNSFRCISLCRHQSLFSVFLPHLFCCSASSSFICFLHAVITRRCRCFSFFIKLLLLLLLCLFYFVSGHLYLVVICNCSDFSSAFTHTHTQTHVLHGQLSASASASSFFSLSSLAVALIPASLSPTISQSVSFCTRHVRNSVINLNASMQKRFGFSSSSYFACFFCSCRVVSTWFLLLPAAAAVACFFSFACISFCLAQLCIIL